MSSGEEWANDAPRPGCPLSVSLLVLALMAIAALTLTGCDTPRGGTPAVPVTGPQPQPPVTTVVPSAVRVIS